MPAMLFAAGLGSRLKPFTDKHPKALAVVNGRTLLEHNIRYLQRHGIHEVVVNVHHFAQQIIDVLQAQHGFGSKIHIADEQDEVLETGGGLLKAAPFFAGHEAVVLMNVDVLTNLDLSAMMAAHEATKPLATLAVMQRESTRRLLFDGGLQLCGWKNLQTGDERISRAGSGFQALAFSGVQVISEQFLESISLKGKFSLIDAYLAAAVDGIVLGYDHTGDIMMDVGKPESVVMAGRVFM